MLNRKLEAVVLTLAVGFLIVPFLFREWHTDYFMIGFVVTLYAAPILLVIGFPFSWWVEKRVNNVTVSIVLHAFAGGAVGALFGWIFLMSLNLTTYFLAGMIYATLYSLFDLLLQKTRFYNKHSGLEAS